ncbi:MAG: energy-coupling factor transporter transmembrane protein EcfT [Spirochaetaceae bacterium]|nr:MAG: energy-coupling factor transporter transmembrane protein EcfT [Spirochaetaceae bacterium]
MSRRSGRTRSRRAGSKGSRCRTTSRSGRDCSPLRARSPHTTEPLRLRARSRPCSAKFRRRFMRERHAARTLNPGTKLAAVVVGLVAILAATNALALIPGVVLMFVTIVYVRPIAASIMKPAAKIFPFVVLFTLFQVLFAGPGGHVVFTLGPVGITDSGIISGALFGARVVITVLYISTIASITRPEELSLAVEVAVKPLRRLRLPVDGFALALTVALQFLPTLTAEAHRITRAQAARGAAYARKGGFAARIRMALPMVVPLFLFTLTHAERVAEALEARAYRFGAERTRLVEHLPGLADHVTRFFIVLAAVAAIVLSYVA